MRAHTHPRLTDDGRATHGPVPAAHAHTSPCVQSTVCCRLSSPHTATLEALQVDGGRMLSLMCLGRLLLPGLTGLLGPRFQVQTHTSPR